MHVSPDPTFVSLGTWHTIPVTQTQLIVHRGQDEFPTWRAVVLYANHLRLIVLFVHVHTIWLAEYSNTIPSLLDVLLRRSLSLIMRN